MILYLVAENEQTLFSFNCSLLRLKKHKTNCEKAELDKSAVAKHAWTYDHRIKWDEANILAIDSLFFFIYLFIY